MCYTLKTLSLPTSDYIHVHDSEGKNSVVISITTLVFIFTLRCSQNKSLLLRRMFLSIAFCYVLYTEQCIIWSTVLCKKQIVDIHNNCTLSLKGQKEMIMCLLELFHYLNCYEKISQVYFIKRPTFWINYYYYLIHTFLLFIHFIISILAIFYN